MKRRTAEELGAVAAGLVGVHEHERTLRQERRLAGKPTFGDQLQGPLVLMTVLLVGAVVYGVVVIVAAVWPWLLGLAALVVGWRLRRRWRRQGYKS